MFDTCVSNMSGKGCNMTPRPSKPAFYGIYKGLVLDYQYWNPFFHAT